MGQKRKINVALLANISKSFKRFFSKQEKSRIQESFKKSIKPAVQEVIEGPYSKGQARPAWWTRLYDFRQRPKNLSTHLYPIRYFGTFSPVRKFNFSRGSKTPKQTRYA